MNSTDLTHLNGASVLVRSSCDHRNPPTAMRGTIEAKADGAGWPSVKIVLDYPDMFTTPAHQGVIVLDAAQVEQLLASEHDGVYALTIDDPLDPEPEPPEIS